jgi:hypothetical protein
MIPEPVAMFEEKSPFLAYRTISRLETIQNYIWYSLENM